MIGIILLGFLIVFGLPAGVGLAVASRSDAVLGVIVGIVLFLAIVGIGYRHMMKQQSKGDHRHED